LRVLIGGHEWKVLRKEAIILAYKVFYDAMCPLCSTVRQVVEKLDWLDKFEWIAVQKAEEMEEYSFLQGRNIYDRIHMLAPDGELYTGFYTVRKILNLLVLTYPLSLLLYLPLIDKVLDPLYMWVSENRYEWFGRKESPDYA
jgi:predicted DCC family thiol-disulfide oxidoreductase YuxK